MYYPFFPLGKRGDFICSTLPAFQRKFKQKFLFRCSLQQVNLPWLQEIIFPDQKCVLEAASAKISLIERLWIQQSTSQILYNLLF